MACAAQRFIVRIIFMVPLYSLLSFLSLLMEQNSVYFDTFRDWCAPAGRSGCSEGVQTAGRACCSCGVPRLLLTQPLTSLPTAYWALLLIEPTDGRARDGMHHG